jgi:hypothetical protein
MLEHKLLLSQQLFNYSLFSLCAIFHNHLRFHLNCYWINTSWPRKYIFSTSICKNFSRGPSPRISQREGVSPRALSPRPPHRGGSKGHGWPCSPHITPCHLSGHPQIQTSICYGFRGLHMEWPSVQNMRHLTGPQTIICRNAIAPISPPA